MTRFIQQRIKPLISRFIPKAWCPSCGSQVQALSSDARQKTERKPPVKRKTSKMSLETK